MEKKWADAANTMADLAASIAKEYFRKTIEFHRKLDGTSVSGVDLAIEKAIRDYLEKYYPEHGILGEEYGCYEKDSEYIWVIDPIDGTASFLSGKPTFCTLIALLKNDEPILGLISQPILQERWLGIKNQRTLFNGQPISMSPSKKMGLRFSCTTPQMFKTSEEKLIYQSISQQAAIASYGGDAYAYGLLALGFIDLILEADLDYYDIAALIPVIEGVGGQLTDWQNCAISKNTFKGQVLAVNACYKDIYRLK